MGYNGGCGMQPGEVRIIPNRLSRTHATAGCGGPKVTNHSSALGSLELPAGEGEICESLQILPVGRRL